MTTRTAGGRRPPTRGAPPGAGAGTDRRQVQVDLPLQLWRQFQIQLVVDNSGPQQWISAQVGAFLQTPRERRRPVPYGRVPRDGATRQVGARIPVEQFRAFRLALVEVGKPPVSWWLYQRILEYAGETRVHGIAAQAVPHARQSG